MRTRWHVWLVAMAVLTAGVAQAADTARSARQDGPSLHAEAGAGLGIDPILAPGWALSAEIGLGRPVQDRLRLSGNWRSHWLRGTTDEVVVRGWDTALLASLDWRAAPPLRLRASAGPARISHEAASRTGYGRLRCYALALGGRAAYELDAATGQAVGLSYTRWCANVHAVTLTYSFPLDPGGWAPWD